MDIVPVFHCHHVVSPFFGKLLTISRGLRIIELPKAKIFFFGRRQNLSLFFLFALFLYEGDDFLRERILPFAVPRCASSERSIKKKKVPANRMSDSIVRGCKDESGNPLTPSQTLSMRIVYVLRPKVNRFCEGKGGKKIGSKSCD